MGTDLVEVKEQLPSPQAIKVHRFLCIELLKFVERVSKIFPEVEEARPRCSAGIQALCSLNNAIEKAKLILLRCCESSKLYLAITGDVMLLRCKKSRNMLEQSLSQIQTMVPVMLAAKISQIVTDLRSATFTLDPSEEEAGKVLRAFFQQYASAADTADKSVLETIQFAALRLNITSQRALLIEKRSIRRLVTKVGEGEPEKKQILLFLLDLLERYGQCIVKEQTENACIQSEESVSFATSCDQSVGMESRVEYGQEKAQPDMLIRSIPEEFKCPISLQLMHDPVSIASGQTFERMWIQKWFKEGNDTCPKTKRKLAHLSLTPNITIKEHISKWCVDHGVTIPDPFVQSAASHSWEISSTSIASLSNSMINLHLPIDFSNVSLGSLDNSYTSESSSIRTANSLKSMPVNYDLHNFQSPETNMEFLSQLDSLSWETKCKAVEDVKFCLTHDDQACYSLTSENFVEPLIRFLTDAHDLHDVKALKTGSQLLLAFVSKCRISYLREDAYSLLVSFLDSEAIAEALAIMEVLSCFQYCRTKIVAAGALTPIQKIIGANAREFLEPAIKILYNLSLNGDIGSLIVSLKFIPKLVPLFEDIALARYCVMILRNLCDREDARISVAEADGCIASIAKLLETDIREDQEHAVSVLLSLCSQHVRYCQLVMDENVFPNLASISINGNDKGRASALELLRILRDIKCSDVQQCSGSDVEFSRDSGNQSMKKKSSSKASGLFGMKISLFTKPNSSEPKRKK